MSRIFISLLAFFMCLNSFSQAYKIDPVNTDSSLYKNPNKLIQNITLIGNKITKKHIVLRELLFKVGDTIPSNEFLAVLEQSKKNILNTSLFNFAKIDWALIDSEKVQIVITLTERWYTFPLPIFEIDDNNFNTWWETKDYSRINYGFHLVRNNFRGRKEKLSLTAQFGFTERFRIRYNIPYINKNQKGGLGFSFSYNRRDEIAYTSLNNERLQFKSETNDAIKNYSAGVSYNYRREIFSSHSFGLQYDQNQIIDSVRILNPNYLGQNRLRSKYFSLYYNFTIDKRDSKNYPLAGKYFRFNIRKTGLGILKDNVDLTNLNAQFRNYWQLKDKLFLANSVRAEYALNNDQPYLLQNGLGYSSTYAARAYELYVIDGQNIGLIKTQLKYQLVKPTEVDFKFIGYDKLSKFHYAFYLGIFSDFAYVDDNTGFQQNNLANELLYSGGIGLDFITYYDIVFRTEFSVNKFGESGIFLHFVAPI